jgi:hypothetical protein
MHQSRRKMDRELLDFIAVELREAGVTHYTVSRTADNHMRVFFPWRGKTQMLTCTGTSDWKSRLKTRSHLRGMLT